jgi:hypothetical protein
MKHSVLALALAAATFGCGSFGRDRAYDLAQTFDLSVGHSEGFAVNVRATKVFQVGLGSYRGLRWIGLEEGVFDRWSEERSELGIGPLYVHEYFRDDGERLLDYQHPLWGDPGFREHAYDFRQLTDRDVFDFGVTANVALVGIDVAFKGREFFDFCAGFFGADPLEDDVHDRSLDALRQQAFSDDAVRRRAALRALLLRTGDDFGYAVYTAPREMPRAQIDALRRLRDRLETGPAAPDAPAESAAPTAATAFDDSSTEPAAPPRG